MLNIDSCVEHWQLLMNTDSSWWILTDLAFVVYGDADRTCCIYFQTSVINSYVHISSAGSKCVHAFCGKMSLKVVFPLSGLATCQVVCLVWQSDADFTLHIHISSAGSKCVHVFCGKMSLKVVFPLSGLATCQVVCLVWQSDADFTLHIHISSAGSKCVHVFCGKMSCQSGLSVERVGYLSGCLFGVTKWRWLHIAHSH